MFGKDPPRLLRAEIQIARRNYYEAHKLLQEFLGEYAGTQLGDRAADLEFVIAEVFLSGTKRKLWGMRILSSEDIGLEILDQLATEYPGSGMAESAIKAKADHFFDQGDFALAELEYARLVQEFKDRYGSIICDELLDVPSTGAEDVKRYMDSEDRREQCNGYVRFVVEQLFGLD